MQQMEEGLLPAPDREAAPVALVAPVAQLRALSDGITYTKRSCGSILWKRICPQLVLFAIFASVPCFLLFIEYPDTGGKIAAGLLGGWILLVSCVALLVALRRGVQYIKQPRIVVQLDSDGVRKNDAQGTTQVAWTDIRGVHVHENKSNCVAKHIAMVELSHGMLFSVHDFEVQGGLLELSQGMRVNRQLNISVRDWEVQGGLKPLFAALMQHAPNPNVQPQALRAQVRRTNGRETERNTEYVFPWHQSQARPSTVRSLNDEVLANRVDISPAVPITSASPAVPR